MLFLLFVFVFVWVFLFAILTLSVFLVNILCGLKSLVNVLFLVLFLLFWAMVCMFFRTILPQQCVGKLYLVEIAVQGSQLILLIPLSILAHITCFMACLKAEILFYNIYYFHYFM